MKELAAHFLEPRLQVRGKTAALVRRLDDREPMITWIAPTRKKTARFEPVHKARDLAFVSPHRLGELSSRSLALLCTMHVHRRCLRRHPKLPESPFKRRLLPIARPEQPGYREFSLP